MIIQLSREAIRRFYLLVIAIDAFLILITGLSDLGVPVTASFKQFDLKLEGTFGVWYSSLLLLLVSAAAFGIGKAGSPSGDRNTLYRWTWYALATVFLALSIDETAQLHEAAGRVFSRWFGSVPGLTDGGIVFGWLVLAFPAICLFVIGMILAARTWLALHPGSRTLALGGVACWVGVICAEIVEAQLRRWSLSRSIQGVIEEGLEIVGATLFLMSFLEFLQSTQWKPRPPPSGSLPV